jgi:uncharacterized protein (DUF2249 family)
MLNPQLKKFIEDSLESGADERIIERKLVSRGWNRNEVLKAISEVKGAFTDKKGVKMEKKMDKRFIVTLAAVFVVFLVFAIMFLQVGKKPETWCKKGALWTDILVDKNQQFIVKQNFTFLNKTVCYAVAKDNPNLGYRFTQNNEEIWKLEIKQDPKNASRKIPTLTQIKPAVKIPVQQTPAQQQAGQLAWCKKDSVWTDPLVPKNDTFIIRNSFLFQNKTVCYASNAAQNLGYRFTENNKEIWRLEIRQNPRNASMKLPVLIQIKPAS